MPCDENSIGFVLNIESAVPGLVTHIYRKAVSVTVVKSIKDSLRFEPLYIGFGNRSKCFTHSRVIPSQQSTSLHPSQTTKTRK
jgi:hypothetical protein